MTRLSTGSLWSAKSLATVRNDITCRLNRSFGTPQPRLGWHTPLGRPPRLGREVVPPVASSVSPRRATALEPAAGCRAVADPDSHSLLIPGPLDALAGFQASFSDALRGELHRLAALRAGERRCRFRHAARIARLARRPTGARSRACGSPTPGAFSREPRRVPAGAGHGPQGNLLTPGRARSRTC